MTRILSHWSRSVWCPDIDALYLPSTSRTQSPLSTWQAKNWDPAVGSTKFEEFCEALDKSIFGHSELLPEVDDATTYDPQTRMVSFSDGLTLDISILNYAKFVREVSIRGL